MLFFILIAIAWLGVLSLLVAICRIAAAGDRTGVRAERVDPVAIGPKLVLAAPSHEPAPRARRPHAQRTLRHGVRTRAARAPQLNV